MYIFLLLLLLVAGTFANSPREVIELGRCGANCQAELDLTMRALIIKGSGKMDDYTFNPKSPIYPPWGSESIVKYIQSIEIEDKITSIGNSAFYGLSHVFRVKLPSKLQTIGDSAFAWCEGLTEVNLQDCKSLTKIDVGAFESSGLISVVIPDTVNEIGDAAFARCPSLFCVILGTKASQLKTVGKAVFRDSSRMCSVSYNGNNYDIKFDKNNLPFFNTNVKNIKVTKQFDASAHSKFLEVETKQTGDETDTKCVKSADMILADVQVKWLAPARAGIAYIGSYVDLVLSLLGVVLGAAALLE